MEKLDVVYILRNSSRWNNNEIRYSLRSLKNLEQADRVFLIGFCPRFINKDQVAHIPAEDPYQNKIKNAVHKLKIACKDDRISKDFILMNDDFFFLKQVKEIEYFNKGNLEKTAERHETKGGYYYRALRATVKMLKQKEKSCVDFEVHYPIIFNKEKLLKVIESLEGMGEGHLFRSLYGNVYEIKGRYKKDVKIFKEEELERLTYLDFVSTDDSIVLSPKFQKMIGRKLKDPSKYEISTKEVLYAVNYFRYQDRTYNPGEIIKENLPERIMRSPAIRRVKVKTF
jgi:hypothetical protein